MVCKLLQCPEADLERCLLLRELKLGNELTRVPNTVPKAGNARDALAMLLYHSHLLSLTLTRCFRVFDV